MVRKYQMEHSGSKNSHFKLYTVGLSRVMKSRPALLHPTQLVHTVEVNLELATW